MESIPSKHYKLKKTQCRGCGVFAKSISYTLSIRYLIVVYVQEIISLKKDNHKARRQNIVGHGCATIHLPASTPIQRTQRLRGGYRFYSTTGSPAIAIFSILYYAFFSCLYFFCRNLRLSLTSVFFSFFTTLSVSV